MNVHISYKLPRTPDIDKEIQHWMGKVQKRLQVFRPELIHLKGLLEQNSAREGATVSLNLRLPSGQMAVQESAPNATSAVKAAFDDLLGQIGRHKDLLRDSRKWQRRRANRPAPEQVPFEETIASVATLSASSEEVRSFVNANFRRLRIFIERELFFRENSGDLDPDSLSPEEVVDETVARALDEKIEKPDRLGIEAWFYRLSIQAMDELQSRIKADGSDVELHGLQKRRNESASDEPRMQFHQPDEAMTAESRIADFRISTPEQIAYTDEMISLVQFALQDAEPEDREAFILHAIEGFSVEEIAAITDHNRENVQRAIDRTREELRRSFPVNGQSKSKSKDKLLRGTAVHQSA